MVVPVKLSDLSLRNAVCKSGTQSYSYKRPQPNLSVDKDLEKKLDQKYNMLPERDRYNRPHQLNSNYIELRRCFTHRNQNVNGDKALIAYYGLWLFEILKYLKSVSFHSLFVDTYKDFDNEKISRTSDINHEASYRLIRDPYFPNDLLVTNNNRIQGYFILENLCICMLFVDAFTISWKYFRGTNCSSLPNFFIEPIFIQNGRHIVEMAIRELPVLCGEAHNFEICNELSDCFWNLTLKSKIGSRVISFVSCLDKFQESLIQVVAIELTTVRRIMMPELSTRLLNSEQDYLLAVHKFLSPEGRCSVSGNSKIDYVVERKRPYDKTKFFDIKLSNIFCKENKIPGPKYVRKYAEDGFIVVYHDAIGCWITPATKVKLLKRTGQRGRHF